MLTKTNVSTTYGWEYSGVNNQIVCQGKRNVDNAKTTSVLSTVPILVVPDLEADLLVSLDDEPLAELVDEHDQSWLLQ